MPKFKCTKCKKEPGTCEIDKDNTSMICGVVGLVDFFNVKIVKKQVICVNCNSVIYKEE